MARRGRSTTQGSEIGSPVVRRRELGALLRALRTQAGFTVDQVAESLLVSPSKVSRLETGQRGASLRDVRDLCDLYHVEHAQREHLARLARQGRGQAWWQPYALPYATYVGLEAEARLICDYEPGVFPGLLQTPDYARTIHECAMPRLSPTVIEEQIEVRLVRQAILTRENPPAPQFEAIMDEAVLRRPVGGPAIMSAQIGRVIELRELANVTIRVLPFAAGAHPALDSTFTLLEFEDPLPGVVYVEGLVGHLYVERPQDVQRYKQVFEQLRTISLDEPKSLDLLASISAAYKKT